jgi:hypothetical protein
VVSKLGVVVQGAGMRIIIRTWQERGFAQMTHKIHKINEGRRVVKIEKNRCFFHEGVITDTAALLMARDIVPIHINKAINAWKKQVFDDLRGQETFQEDALMLVLIHPLYMLKIQPLNGLQHLF